MPSLHDKIWEREVAFTPIIALDTTEGTIRGPITVCVYGRVVELGADVDVDVDALKDIYEPVTPTVIVETRDG